MLSKCAIPRRMTLARAFASAPDFTKYKPKNGQLLIDGKFVNSVSGKVFDTFNPATEEKIFSV